MRQLLLTVLLLVATALTSLAHAQGSDNPEQLIGWARAAEEDLEYDRALELWNTVVAHPAVTQAQRVEASFHAGSIERVRGNQLQARVHFMYVLDQDLDFQLPPSTEPKIGEFFEMIRAEMRQKSAATSSAAADAATPVGATDGAEPADVEEAPAAGGPGALTYAGAAVAGLGVVAAGLAGTSGVLSNMEQDAAMQSSVQLEREARYDQRDVYANLATGGWVASGALLLAGAGMILLDVTSAGDAE